jgi:hypothetical protein
MAEKYLRRLRVWIPDEIKRSVEARYGFPLIRSSGRSHYEETQWVQTLYPVSDSTALLLDLELSEYIIS